MATTSPDNIRTPDPGDPYNLVADLATLASSVQSALTKRANRFIGTTAQMNATAAPNGAEWYNTSDNKEYIRKGGVWVEYNNDSGWISITSLSNGGVPQHGLAYRKIRNEVVFRGSISGTAAGGSGVAVFTLPSGFIPASYQWYPSTINVNYTRAISVASNGVVTIWKHGSDTATSYVAMSGVRFFVD